MIIKQIKIFAYSLLTFVAIGVFSVVIFSQNNQPSQNGCGDNCCQTQVMIVQKTESKEVNLVYDFARGTVSTVTIRKDFSEPEMYVKTKKLVQQ